MFIKGVSGNPGGRKSIPEDIRKCRELAKYDLERSLLHFLKMPIEDLKKTAQDPKAETKDVIVASIISKAIKLGCHQRFEFLLGRLLGKVKEEIDVTARVLSVVTVIGPEGVEELDIEARRRDQTAQVSGPGL